MELKGKGNYPERWHAAEKMKYLHDRTRWVYLTLKNI